MPDERSRVLTLVFTDLAGSTALKTERGDQAVGELIGRHRELVTQLAADAGGRIIDWAGDGCFLAFETPSAGVTFGLKLQQAHAKEPDLPGVRVGVHMGEVTDREQQDGSVRIEGLAVDLASRIESLGAPGQVLMSSAVFDSARQRLHGDALDTPIAWLAHGPYELKGFDDSLEICEAGFEGISPLEAPTGSEKAHRAVTPAEEDTLGWRPAVGLTVPQRDNWVLHNQLGVGGFGEVWLAAHKKTKAKRVFKFCFEADRVKGLKREVVLFRLLRESLGDREDIAQILDWEFEKPPYFLEAEYTEGGDLKDWAKDQGGIAEVPLKTRLDLVAQTAVALGAAHSVGVLHKDVKPANILVRNSLETGVPRARLTDFGIGLITDKQALIDRGITAAGMTDTLVGASSSSGSGTRLYMAPEVIEGKPPTTLSDIYSLGVVLYQVAIGDLTRGVATGWERDIEDELLREDIAACVDGSPERRITSAAELAERLRTLGERHAKLDEERRLREEAEHAAEIAEKARRRRKQFTVATSLGIALTVIIALAALRENRRAKSESGLRIEAESARTEALAAHDEAEQARILEEQAREEAEQGQYVATIQLAAARLAEGDRTSARNALLRTPAHLRNFEWGYLVNQAWPYRPGIDDAPRIQPRPGETTASLWARGEPHVALEITATAAGIMNVNFSPDARLLATGLSDNQAKVFDVQSGELVHTIISPAGPVVRVVFSHDGAWLATCELDGRIRLWNTADWSLDKELVADDQSSRGFAWFSPDDSYLVVARADGSIQIWDPSTAELLSGSQTHSSAVRSVHFLEDSSAFLAGSMDGLLRTLSLPDAEEIAPPVKSPENSTDAVISPDGSKVATMLREEKIALVWDLESGEVTHRVAHGVFGLNSIFPPAFSNDGSALLTRSAAGVNEVWDLAASQRVALLDEDPASVFDPTGLQFAVVEGGTGGTVKIVRLYERHEATRRDVLDSHSDIVFNINISSDGSRMATASYDRTVKIWDAHSGELLKTLDPFDDEVRYAAFSPDDSRLVAMTYRTTSVWDTTTWERLFVYGDASTPISPLLAARGGIREPGFLNVGSALIDYPFSKDGKTLQAMAGADIALVDLESGHTTPAGNGGSYQNMHMSADWTLGIQLSQDIGSFEIWDLVLKQKRFTVSGHETGVLGSAFSPDAKRLVTGSLDGAVKVWDPATGELIHELEGHAAFILVIRYSADGRFIVTTGGDAKAKLWDAETYELVATFEGGRPFVDNALFSPDGTRLLTSSGDGSANVWDLQGNELLSIAPGGNLIDVAWAPDGNRILTTWADGKVQLYDAVPIEELSRIGDDETPFEERLSAWRMSIRD